MRCIYLTAGFLGERDVVDILEIDSFDTKAYIVALTQIVSILHVKVFATLYSSWESYVQVKLEKVVNSRISRNQP